MGLADSPLRLAAVNAERMSLIVAKLKALDYWRNMGCIRPCLASTVGSTDGLVIDFGRNKLDKQVVLPM